MYILQQISESTQVSKGEPINLLKNKPIHGNVWTLYEVWFFSKNY